MSDFDELIDLAKEMGNIAEKVMQLQHIEELSKKQIDYVRNKRVLENPRDKMGNVYDKTVRKLEQDMSDEERNEYLRNKYLKTCIDDLMEGNLDV